MAAQSPGNQVFVWTVEAFRRTGLTMTVDKNTAEIVDPIGEFGMVAVHENKGDDVLVHELYGGGVRRLGRVYEVRVPDGGSAVVQTSVAANPPASFPPPTLPPTIEPGSHGDGVGQAQLLLSVEGYGIGASEINDVFGPLTENVVQIFQRTNALAVDGVVGPATWSALFGLAPRLDPPVPPVLQSGASGAMVTDLQSALNSTRRWFARWLPPLAENGEFDPPTVAMVKALQSWARVTTDGVGGYDTWAASAGPTLWQDAGAQAASAKHGNLPLVRQGSTGDAAQQAQFLLSSRGLRARSRPGRR